ncbi:cysteine desulfurase [[Synechococcus] sp. NIES-970]|nr:cysteine desulfurase [[Synechococcus] sp. NIES-970]
MQIYLDYSATTPPHPLVLQRVQAVCTEGWGNPSSLHSWGNRAATLLETARCQVASLIGAANPDEIVFTAGGTEADNLAIFGITSQYPEPQHLIISQVEHPAIARAADTLETQGWQVTRLGVDGQGRIAPTDLEQAIQSNTVLISIIYGQSEIGTIQPIAALGAIAKKQGILFHTDAVQAVGRIPIDLQTLPVDLLSLSGHKIYGLQGAGALYVRDGVELKPQIYGGGQERSLRSGTQNLPGIVALGTAAELAEQTLPEESLRLLMMRNQLLRLGANHGHLQITGDCDQRLPHHVSFALRQDSPLLGLTGKAIVRQLNLAGIAISAGSACHSGKLNPSAILKAIGYGDRQALSGIRLTLGAQTQTEDIEWTTIALQQILERQYTAVLV